MLMTKIYGYFRTIALLIPFDSEWLCLLSIDHYRVILWKNNIFILYYND